MEFLNGLKNSAGTVSWESLPRSREAGHSTSCFESGTLRPALKVDLFGKMPRLLACGSAARVLQCTEITPTAQHTPPEGISKGSFCQQAVALTLLLEGAWLMLNHFIGRQGKCSIDHGGAESSSVYFVLFFKVGFPPLPFSL